MVVVKFVPDAAERERLDEINARRSGSVRSAHGLGRVSPRLGVSVEARQKAREERLEAAVQAREARVMEREQRRVEREVQSAAKLVEKERRVAERQARLERGELSPWAARRVAQRQSVQAAEAEIRAVERIANERFSQQLKETLARARGCSLG